MRNNIGCVCVCACVCAADVITGEIMSIDLFCGMEKGGEGV